jgi:putative oxidoreductase
MAVLFGLLTRLASLGLASTMVVAILLVHIKAGFFAPNGFEFPLSLLAIAAALISAGAGRWSVDALIARRRDVTNETQLNFKRAA